jgi:hypothetical protein
MSAHAVTDASAVRPPATGTPATTRKRPAAVPDAGTRPGVGDDATRAIEARQFLESITAREPRRPRSPAGGTRGAHPGSIEIHRGRTVSASPATEE